MIAAGNGGRVINIGSINSLVAGRNIAGRHYETAKERFCNSPVASPRIGLPMALPSTRFFQVVL